MEKVSLQVSEFIRSESAGGILLVAAAFQAMLFANSPLSHYYDMFLSIPVHIRVGPLEIAMYIFIGSIMWVSLLKSGVHATLGGVILAMFIPMRSRKNPEHSPLIEIEHDLQPVTAFLILPIFAFCNSGVNLTGASVDFLIHGVPVGIALGLFLGKQLGVFAFLWLGIRLGISAMLKGMNWSSLYGLACLCGIGFTMSLFIGSLAFDQTVNQLVFDERLGIIVGSLLSGFAGILILHKSLSSDNTTGQDTGT